MQYTFANLLRTLENICNPSSRSQYGRDFQDEADASAHMGQVQSFRSDESLTAAVTNAVAENDEQTCAAFLKEAPSQPLKSTLLHLGGQAAAGNRGLGSSTCNYPMDDINEQVQQLRQQLQQAQQRWQQQEEQMQQQLQKMQQQLQDIKEARGGHTGGHLKVT